MLRPAQSLRQLRLFSTATATASPNASPSLWVTLTGFSPFACRLDLQLLLGSLSAASHTDTHTHKQPVSPSPSLSLPQPLVVDPLLDRHLFPTGRYALQCQSVDDARQFKKLLSSVKHVRRFNATLESRHPGLPLPPSLSSHASSAYAAAAASAKKGKSNKPLYVNISAASVGVSNKTVRVMGLPENIGFSKAHLAYYLENYAVAKKVGGNSNSDSGAQNKTAVDSLNIRPVPFLAPGKVQFFVDLETEEEAVRLTAELGNALFDGQEISMLHYHM